MRAKATRRARVVIITIVRKVLDDTSADTAANRADQATRARTRKRRRKRRSTRSEARKSTRNAKPRNDDVTQVRVNRCESDRVVWWNLNACLLHSFLLAHLVTIGLLLVAVI